MKKTSDFTLLFADDNDGVKEIYRKAFEKEGYRVLICDNASQIVADLKAEKVDLLVTDLAMPDANTLELFPLLKKDYPRLPVIVVSGRYVGMQEEFLARGYNITAFIPKPTDVKTLKEKVKEILKIDSK